MTLASYYQDREPTTVFFLTGKIRGFVAYDAGVLADVIIRIKTGTPTRVLYAELMRRALAGDTHVRALPPDSPPWTRRGGRWRPVEASSVGRTP